jgi:hypothetical protein
VDERVPRDSSCAKKEDTLCTKYRIQGVRQKADCPRRDRCECGSRSLGPFFKPVPRSLRLVRAGDWWLGKDARVRGCRVEQ